MVHGGDHLFPPFQLVLEVFDGLVQLFAARLEVGQTGAGDLIGRGDLRLLLVAHMIQVEQLADFFEAETKALAAQDQLEPGAVAFGEQAFLALAQWEEQLFRFVEPQGAGGHFESVAHLANGQRVGGHLITLQSSFHDFSWGLAFLIQWELTLT